MFARLCNFSVKTLNYAFLNRRLFCLYEYSSFKFKDSTRSVTHKKLPSIKIGIFSIGKKQITFPKPLIYRKHKPIYPKDKIHRTFNYYTKYL